MIVLAQALQSCPSLQRLSVGSQVRTLPYFLPSSRQFRWQGLASWVFQVSDTGVLVLVKLIPQLGSLEHLTLGSYMESTETLSALLEVRCIAHGSLHRPMSAAAVHMSSRAGARAPIWSGAESAKS